jgi:TonB family protein
MNSTLGILPETRRNPAAIITSLFCNLSIIGLLFCFGATAVHRLAPQKYMKTDLYLPPRPTPLHVFKMSLPPQATRPAEQSSVIQNIPPVQKPRIQVEKPVNSPEPGPLTLPESKSPEIQIAHNTPNIVLAPQPKAAINITQLQNMTVHTQESVVGAHFGQTTGQKSNSKQTVATARFGSFQTSSANKPSGQVSTAAIPSRVAIGIASVPKVSSSPSVTEVEVLSGPKPEYTNEARQLHIQGTVILHVVVTASGQLRVLAIIHGLGHGLDQSAVKAVERYRIKPATRDGIPVDTTTNITITFQLA